MAVVIESFFICPFVVYLITGIKIFYRYRHIILLFQFHIFMPVQVIPYICSVLLPLVVATGLCQHTVLIVFFELPFGLSFVIIVCVLHFAIAIVGGAQSFLVAIFVSALFHQVSFLVIFLRHSGVLTFL